MDEGRGSPLTDGHGRVEYVCVSGAGLSFSFPFENESRGGAISGDSQSLPSKPLPSASQVFPAFKPHPDTLDSHGQSWASWLCPWPLAPAKSALLACPQGLDLYLCALQSATLATAPRGLREDALSARKLGGTGHTRWRWDVGAGIVRFEEERRSSPMSLLRMEPQVYATSTF